MSEPTFLAYWNTPGPNEGWYSTVRPTGFDFENHDHDWATRYDQLRFGPFATSTEAEEAIDTFFERSGVDRDALIESTKLAAAHADEMFEADQENYPGGELAKRRFQVAAKSFHKACANGNPPPEIVGVSAGNLFVMLCAAYPSAGAEIFRRIGNMSREQMGVPEMHYGEIPTYED